LIIGQIGDGNGASILGINGVSLAAETLSVSNARAGNACSFLATAGMIIGASGDIDLQPSGYAKVNGDHILTDAKIGGTVQGYDAELACIAGLVSAADTFPYFTGSGTAALSTVTAAGRALIDDPDATTQRATLGLGAMAVVDNPLQTGRIVEVIKEQGTTNLL